MEDWLIDFYEQQLLEWDLAFKNNRALDKIKKKLFKIGDLEGSLQFNPARANSTLAKTDKKSIASRPCFLCKNNRPPEQKQIEIIPEWELLVNPFPIFHYHFSIVNKCHTPQKPMIDYGFKLAEKLSGMVVLYNDVGAGASAPDHMHFQAVPVNKLPLISLIEKEAGNINNLDIPFRIITDLNLIEKINRPYNIYFWNSSKGMKFIAVPRKSHRPKEYFLEPPKRIAISPGAIDIAGVMIVPLEEDFNIADCKAINRIYQQVAYAEGEEF